jgi:hypothetical protein
VLCVCGGGGLVGIREREREGERECIYLVHIFSAYMSGYMRGDEFAA